MVPEKLAVQKVPTLLGDAVVQRIATKHKATSGQILPSWGVRRNTTVIPRSENEARMQASLTVRGGRILHTKIREANPFLTQRNS